MYKFRPANDERMAECSACGASEALFRVKNPDGSYTNERLCRACRERAIKIVANPPPKASKTGMTVKQLMAMLSFPHRRKKAQANVIPPTPVPGAATIVANPEMPGSKAKYHRHRQIPPSCFQGTEDKFKTVDIRHTDYPRRGRYFRKGVKAIVGRLKRSCMEKFGKRGKRVKFHAWATQSILTPKKYRMKPTVGEKKLESNPDAAPIGVYFAKIKKWPPMVTAEALEGIRETKHALDNMVHRNPPVVEANPRPITRYSITYFEIGNDAGEEKTWTFDTMEEAVQWRKELSENYETPEEEIVIETVKHGKNPMKVYKCRKCGGEFDASTIDTDSETGKMKCPHCEETVPRSQQNPVPGLMKLGASYPRNKTDLADYLIRELFYHDDYKLTVPDKDAQEFLSPKAVYAKIIGPKVLRKEWDVMQHDGYIHKHGDVWKWGLETTGPEPTMVNPEVREEAVSKVVEKFKSAWGPDTSREMALQWMDGMTGLSQAEKEEVRDRIFKYIGTELNPKGEQFVKLSAKGQDVMADDDKHNAFIRLEDRKIHVDIFDTTVGDDEEPGVGGDAFTNSSIGRNQAKDFLRDYNIYVKFVDKKTKNPLDVSVKGLPTSPVEAALGGIKTPSASLPETNPCAHDWEDIDLNYRRCRKCRTEERRKSPRDEWKEVTHDPVYGTESMTGETVSFAHDPTDGR